MVDELSSTIFPLSKKTTRSPTVLANPISWVTTTIVIPSWANPHKTVLENLTLAPIQVLGLDEESAKQKACNLLQRVGLLYR